MAKPQNEPQQCPLCQVTIQTVNGQDQVMFSRGGAGTRSKLWGRVCQFLRTDDQKGLCINQDSGRRGDEQPGDRYQDVPAIALGRDASEPVPSEK